MGGLKGGAGDTTAGAEHGGSWGGGPKDKGQCGLKVIKMGTNGGHSNNIT